MTLHQPRHLPKHATSTRPAAASRFDGLELDGRTTDPKREKKGADAGQTGPKTDGSQGATTDVLPKEQKPDVNLTDGGGAPAPQEGQQDSDAGGEADADRQLAEPAPTGGPSAPAALPEPMLPTIILPDLNAIRAPIVRNPPKSSQDRAPEVLKETGTTPSGHHAVIQASVFRVTEAARTAQRDMVRSLNSIARNTRWSIEDMAYEIDGVVARCVSTVIGAAAGATASIEAAAQVNEDTMRRVDLTGDEDMEARRTETLALIVGHLKENGSDKLTAVHNRMKTDFVSVGGKYATNVATIVTGQQPAPVGTGTGAKMEFKPPKGEVAASFSAEGMRLAGLLPTVPRGGGGTGGVTDTNYQAFVAEPQAGALIEAGPQQQAKWLEHMTKRTATKTGAGARDAFYLASLGITAPGAEAMNRDDKEYARTLNNTVLGNQRNMDHATYVALSQFHQTLDGVRNFFDPNNKNSMTFSAVKGLRDTGAQIRDGMLSQAQVIEANILASAAPFAEIYPDVVRRLSETLEGNDLMDRRIMLPRIEGVSDTIRSLHQSHLDLLQDQSRQAIMESRAGADLQIGQLWDTTDKTLARIEQHRVGSIAHFAVLEAQFTGEFTRANQLALAGVMRYANAAATRLMRPIRVGGEAGARVTQIVEDHFNRQLVGEYNQHAEKLGKFGEDLGYENPITAATSRGGKPLHNIHKTQASRLNNSARLLAEALPPPVPTWKIVVGVAVVGASFVAAPFTGGASAAFGLGFGAGMGFRVYSSMPKKDKAAAALATLSWPGPLAMNAIWDSSGLRSPSGRTRVQNQANESGDADWRSLAQLFSTNKQTNVNARQSLARDRTWLTGLSNETAMKILQSFSDSELSLVSIADRERMAASIEANFFGLDEEKALAYNDGNRALALAIGFQEILQEARSNGDDTMDQFNQQVTALLTSELQASGHRGLTSPEAMQALENQMYLQLDQRLQHQAGRGPAPRSVNLPVAAQGNFQQAAQSIDPTQSDEDRDAQAARQRAAMVQGMAAARPQTPPAADVTAAKERVLTYMTRDYATYDSPIALFTSGDDWGAHQMADAQRTMGIRPQTDILGFQRMPGVILRGMRAQTKASLRSLVMNGANQTTTNQNQAANTMQTAGQSVFGTTQAEFVNVLQQVEDPAFNLAKHRLEVLQNNPNADTTELAAALEMFNRAKRQRDTNMIAIARRLTNNPNGEMSITTARETVAAEIDRIAHGFDPRLVGEGQNSAGWDIVNEGRIGLRRGMHIATAGAGTYDDLLTQVTANRHKSETAGITAQERRNLGIGGSWLGSETSGDQAQRLELDLDGVAENDVDRLRQASIKTRHDAVDGTSFISGTTMRGSWQNQLMHDRHNALGVRVQEAMRHYEEVEPGKPLPADFRNMTPDQLVPMNGVPDPRIAELLLNDEKNLIGPGKTVDQLADESAIANRAYRDEIGRQEAFFTGLITAAVVVISIVLLLVPGVNVAAAGILTALIGGAATIAVKAGMRGNRYGWEEAAVDVGRTAIEAATAGVGAGMGQAVKAGTPIVGRLARVGSALENGLGKLGAAAAREAITGTISTAATTALDDKIWAKGPGHGLSELFKAGAKGAVTGAISGGVSEAVTKGMGNRLSGALGDGADDAVAAAARRNVPDPATHAMLTEAISGLTGSTLSEATSIAMDIADGKAKFNLKEIGKRLGTAGLREVLQGAARGRIQTGYQRLYEVELGKVMRSGGQMTTAQAKFMRKLAISAGVEQYGRPKFDDNATTERGRYHFDGLDAYRNSVRAAARDIQTLPAAIRARVDGISLSDLSSLRAVQQGGLAKMGEAGRDLKRQMTTQYPGLDAAAILRDLDRHHQTTKAANEADAAAQTAIREKLMSGMDPELRSNLADVPVREIGALSPDGLMALKQAMLLGAGPDHADHVMGRIASGNPDILSNPRLRAEVETLLAGHKGGKEDIASARATRRQEVKELVAPGLRRAFDSFTDAEIKALHVLADGSDVPKAKRTELAALLAKRTGLDDASAMLDAMSTSGQAKAKANADAKDAAARAERLKVMEHVPPELRPLLSHLPEHQLIQIALAQAGQRRLSRGDIRKMARTPAEMKAIYRTIRKPAAGQGGFFHRVSQRRAMLEFAPPGMRAAIRRTPMLTVSDAMFASYVKSLGGGREFAATIMIDGHPVVLIREGAPRTALAEEGFHVVQARDPAFKARLTELNEDVLAAWPTLPVPEKVRLTRIALEAEIAAQLYMRETLSERQARSQDVDARQRMGDRFDAMTLRLETLQRRMTELDMLGPHDMRLMGQGRKPTPDWLERPARLFMEDDTQAVPQQTGEAQTTPLVNERAKRQQIISQMKGIKDNWSRGWGLKGKFETAIRGAINNAGSLEDLNTIGLLVEHATAARNNSNTGKQQILALNAIALGLVNMSTETKQALVAFLGAKGTNIERMQMLASLNENEGYGLTWLEQGTAKTAAGTAMLNYLTQYLNMDRGTKTPQVIGQLLRTMGNAKSDVGSIPHVWEAIAILLARDPVDPAVSKANSPAPGDPLGAFVWALGRSRLGPAIASDIADARQSPDGFGPALAAAFNEGRYQVVVPGDKTFGQIHPSVQAIVALIAGANGDPDIAFTRTQHDVIGHRGGEDFGKFKDLAKAIWANSPRDANNETFALRLDAAIDIVNKTKQSWGRASSVSQMKYREEVSYGDVLGFIQHASLGDETLAAGIIAALPVIAQITGTNGSEVGQKLFWQTRQTPHATEGVTFTHPTRPRVEITMPKARQDGAPSDFHKAALLEMVKLGTEFAEKLGMKPQVDGQTAEFQPPTMEPTFKPSTQSISTTKEGVNKSAKIEILAMREADTLADFVTRLEQTYQRLNPNGDLTKNHSAIFVYLQEYLHVTESTGKGSGAIGKRISAKFGRGKDAISIYVGEEVVMKLGVPDDKDLSPAERARQTDIEYDVSGGDTYPKLINAMLRDLIGGSEGYEAGRMIEMVIDRLKPKLKDGPRSETIAKELALFRAIVAGSEFLRDPMAIPSLMLTLYTFRGLAPTVTPFGTVYPGQAAWGHANFRSKKINAFDNGVLSKAQMKKMVADGLTEERVGLIAEMLNPILKNNLVAHQAMGGGSFVPTIPMFLDFRRMARRFALGTKESQTLQKQHMANAVIKRTGDLLDLAIQRYLRENAGVAGSLDGIDINTVEGRTEIMRTIVQKMYEEIVGNFNNQDTTGEGPDDANG